MHLPQSWSSSCLPSPWWSPWRTISGLNSVSGVQDFNFARLGISTLGFLGSPAYHTWCLYQCPHDGSRWSQVCPGEGSKDLSDWVISGVNYTKWQLADASVWNWNSHCQIVFILQGGILIFSKYLQSVQHLSKHVHLLQKTKLLKKSNTVKSEAKSFCRPLLTDLCCQLSLSLCLRPHNWWSKIKRL